MNLEGPLAPNVLDGGRLKPEFAKKGVQLSRIVDPEISYLYWNMQDPVVGGTHEGEDRAAPRDGDGLSASTRRSRCVRNGQAVAAQYPIPPGVVGHDPK